MRFNKIVLFLFLLNMSLFIYRPLCFKTTKIVDVNFFLIMSKYKYVKNFFFNFLKNLGNNIFVREKKILLKTFKFNSF